MAESQTATVPTRNVGVEVVRSIAELEDVDPLELTPPLYEVIDSDALEDLLASDRVLGKFVFNYKGYEVSVFSDGYYSIESQTT